MNQLQLFDKPNSQNGGADAYMAVDSRAAGHTSEDDEQRRALEKDRGGHDGRGHRQASAAIASEVEPCGGIEATSGDLRRTEGVVGAVVPPPLPEPTSTEPTEQDGSTPVATFLEAALQREIRAADIDNMRLQGLLDQVNHALPQLTAEDLREVRDKVNATGLLLREWLDAANVPDTTRHRAMWAADYDPFEVRHINEGRLPPSYVLAEPDPRHVYSPPYPPNTIGAIVRPDDKAIDDTWKAELNRHKSRGGRVKYHKAEPSTLAPKLEPTPLRPVTQSKPVVRSNKTPTNEPRTAMRTLTERQCELIACMVIENGRAVFGPDEVISDWPALKEVMTALGATYVPGGPGRGGTKRKGSFSFPDGVDAEETLWLAKERGEIFDPKLVGTFLSPDAVADMVAGKLDLAPGMEVLEPSAGRGAIAKAVLRACPEVFVRCVELLDVHRRELQMLDLPIIGADFLAMRPEDQDPPFDAAAMNPPFNGGAECHHVLHAARFVRPGGQLVSIVSRGVTFRKDAPYSSLAKWIERHGAIENMPDGSFAESGTWIRTSMLWGRTCDGCRSGECLR